MVNSLIICIMENTPWRLIYVATGASLILLMLVYIIVLPKSEPATSGEKIATFKHIHVAGHEKGEKVWEFSSESGYVDKDQRTSVLSNVSNGTFYKDSKVISKSLTAPLVKANPSSKIADVFSDKDKRISVDIVFTKTKNNKNGRFANLQADNLSYNPGSKKSTVSGNIVIRDKGVLLKANQMTIDHDAETSDLSDKILIDRKDISLKSETLHFDSKAERLDAYGKIAAQIKGKQRSHLKAGQMTLYLDDKKNVEASGSIEVIQGKKAAVANYLLYNKTTKALQLTGNVRAIIQKGKNLISESSIKNLNNPEAKKLLEGKTFITSDKFTFGTTGGDAKAEGNVIISQKGREAKSNIAEYSDNKDLIILTDNVFLKKNGTWVKSKFVEVSVKNETFTAIGSVEAEFRIRK